MAADDRWWGARAHLQVSAWRGTDHTVVLTPLPDRPAPSVHDIALEVEALTQRGVSRVLTGALHHGETQPFADAGFTVHEQLHLLRHDLRRIPDPTAPVKHRRAWRRDQAAILDIDRRAFDGFWALDARGLDDAVRATPASRYRVTTDGEITGYAITGRAANRGYLQRLAVDPARHRQGIGVTLVADSLRWLRRNGTGVAVVNTQEHNEPALGLYLATGFVLEPHGLTVLTKQLQDPAP